MSRGVLCSLLLGIAIVMPAYAQPDAPPQKPAEPAAELQARIARAVKDLGADSFEVRQAAQAELLKIGLAAEKEVQAAVGSPDPEVAGRARKLLAELAKKKLDVELKKVTWSTILERVKHHAANEDWKRPGFADPLLEEAVEKVIEQANAAAKEERVRMPVRFGDVSAGGGGPRARPGAGQLVCGQGSLEVGHTEGAIFLIDGSVRIAFATNCLIIARGAVTISHGSGNVVLAGHFIDISHDGSMLRRPGPPPAGAAMGGVRW